MRLARGRGKGPRGEEQSPEGSGARRQRLDGLCRVPLVPSPGAGFLAVPDRLHEINVDLLGRWLCDHQAPSGGRGGGAEKGPRGEEQSPEGSGARRQRLDGLCRVPLVPSPGAGFLAVPDRLHEINVDLLGRWLCDHQAPSGGRGGGAEKFPDVWCWWGALAGYAGMWEREKPRLYCALGRGDGGLLPAQEHEGTRVWWVDLSQEKPDPGMEQLISAAALGARTEVVGAVGKEAGRRACGEHQEKREKRRRH
ncbi:uncharacterized protein LOC141936803 isoform X3 [Strix uralensis]|uniref:uncharacterized protein LOC141936803 isoform X3 n=1 Tax=Strix uralensis TaxID=36305 RepID=UPI003DA72FFF